MDLARKPKTRPPQKQSYCKRSPKNVRETCSAYDKETAVLCKYVLQSSGSYHLVHDYFSGIIPHKRERVQTKTKQAPERDATRTSFLPVGIKISPPQWPPEAHQQPRSQAHGKSEKKKKTAGIELGKVPGSTPAPYHHPPPHRLQIIFCLTTVEYLPLSRHGCPIIVEYTVATRSQINSYLQTEPRTKLLQAETSRKYKLAENLARTSES